MPVNYWQQLPFVFSIFGSKIRAALRSDAVSWVDLSSEEFWGYPLELLVLVEILRYTWVPFSHLVLDEVGYSCALFALARQRVD